MYGRIDEATLLQQPEQQRFVFDDVDWDFYQHICAKLDGRRVFVTYHKGRLEVVTVSLPHEKVTELLKRMIHVLAEETNTPLSSAGSVATGLASDETTWIRSFRQRVRQAIIERA